jgi:hypothetical protein
LTGRRHSPRRSKTMAAGHWPVLPINTEFTSTGGPNRGLSLSLHLSLSPRSSSNFPALMSFPNQKTQPRQGSPLPWNNRRLGRQFLAQPRRTPLLSSVCLLPRRTNVRSSANVPARLLPLAGHHHEQTAPLRSREIPQWGKAKCPQQSRLEGAHYRAYAARSSQTISPFLPPPPASVDGISADVAITPQ